MHGTFPWKETAKRRTSFQSQADVFTSLLDLLSRDGSPMLQLREFFLEEGRMGDEAPLEDREGET
jgi:hypothetical protein